MEVNPINPIPSGTANPIGPGQPFPVRLGAEAGVQASLLALTDVAALVLATPGRPVPAVAGPASAVPATAQPSPASVAVDQATTALTSANAAALDAAATARDAAASSIHAAQAASAAAEAVKAAVAALNAANASNNADSEARAGLDAARSAADLGPDATAKYLGAGAMSQVAGPGPGPAEGSQEAILAVDGVPFATAVADNTYSNPHGRNFGQAAAAHTAPLDPAEAPEVDLLT